MAVASHNLRSVSHAIAVQPARRAARTRDLELQVLRGLGDELQDALGRRGFRVRTYCPIGDLVAGMAYLVRRLLENTSNESFLHEQARGRARRAAGGAVGGGGRFAGAEAHGCAGLVLDRLVSRAMSRGPGLRGPRRSREDLHEPDLVGADIRPGPRADAAERPVYAAIGQPYGTPTYA